MHVKESFFTEPQINQVNFKKTLAFSLLILGTDPYCHNNSTYYVYVKATLKVVLRVAIL